MTGVRGRVGHCVDVEVDAEVVVEVVVVVVV